MSALIVNNKWLYKARKGSGTGLSYSYNRALHIANCEHIEREARKGNSVGTAYYDSPERAKHLALLELIERFHCLQALQGKLPVELVKDCSTFGISRKLYKVSNAYAHVVLAIFSHGKYSAAYGAARFTLKGAIEKAEMESYLRPMLDESFTANFPLLLRTALSPSRDEYNRIYRTAHFEQLAPKVWKATHEEFTEVFNKELMR